MTDVPAPPAREAEISLAERRLGHLSIRFLIEVVTTGVGELKTTDALLVLAINQANIAPLTRDPQARSLYGGLDSPAPDERRRPVSVSAVAASLRLPFETARRRVRKLEAQGVCVESGGGVIVPEAFLTAPVYLASVARGHEHLVRFYRSLMDERLLPTLPPSRFDPEGGVPVRGAIRLLADYVLRTAEHAMGEAGDVVTGMVLLALLKSASAEEPRPVPISALARDLALPEETTRRHVLRLVELERCVRTPAGVWMSSEMLSQPWALAFFRDNAVNVHRLFAGLAERGVVDAWESFFQPRGADQPPPIRE